MEARNKPKQPHRASVPGGYQREAEIHVARTGSPEEYAAHLPTLEYLESQSGLSARLIVADEIAERIYKRSPDMNHLRAVRVYAIRLLRKKFGWGQVRIREWIGTKDRNVTSMALRLERDLLFGAVPEGLEPPEGVSEDLAKGLARDAHQAYLERERMGVVARAVRRDLVRALTGQEVLFSHEIAAATGLSTASIAHIRLGTENPYGNTGAT